MSKHVVRDGVQTRRWAVGLSSCGLVAASLLGAVPSAQAADSPCSAATLTASGSCTLPAGYSVQFTIKGGNGGAGGSGGQGGSGGNANTTAGGEGGVGGRGGQGGPGAKVTGVIRNTSSADMVLTIVVGLNGSLGSPGADGVPGSNAAGNPAVVPVVAGGAGVAGEAGGTGGTGQSSSITVSGEATPLITAEGGKGGLGGAGGGGGQGGRQTSSSSTAGAAGTAGQDGAAGALGGTVPSPLPSGWTTVDTTASDVPQVAFGEAQPIPVVKEIMITGSRDTNNSVMIQVVGFTQGLTGATVTPFVKKASEKKFTEGTGKRSIAEDGAFTWQRKSRGKTSVYFASGSVKSNTVTIAAP